MAASAAQKKASAKYDEKNAKQVVLKLNTTNDADILLKLDSVQNRQGYIKNLIRSDMRGNGNVLSQDAIRLLIQPVAKKYNLKRVFLFGSYARSEADPSSDIDLMIEAYEGSSLHDYMQVAEELENRLEKKIDLVEYEAVMRDQSRSGIRFKNHYEKDKVLLYEHH